MDNADAKPEKITNNSMYIQNVTQKNKDRSKGT